MNQYASDWIPVNIFDRKTGEEGGFTVFKRVGRPVIVCLIGSARFDGYFMHAHARESKEGKIVLLPDLGVQSSEEKNQCYTILLEKIRLADEVLILNVNGYVGEHTRNLLLFALDSGKFLRWLEPDHIPGDLKRQLDELSI